MNMSEIIKLIEEQNLPSQEVLDMLKEINKTELGTLDAYLFGFVMGRRAARKKKKATA
ncbi:hypothetical protein SDC9_170198 [bioreactor metagenome]|uniref:Uncharacterized protein n=1 Tax=bioreactor metagenome TaxID=1076179 RepID=A0A645GFS9_9ZZZZ